jgi:hypothetical protein
MRHGRGPAFPRATDRPPPAPLGHLSGASGLQEADFFAEELNAPTPAEPVVERLDFAHRCRAVGPYAGNQLPFSSNRSLASSRVCTGNRYRSSGRVHSGSVYASGRARSAFTTGSFSAPKVFGCPGLASESAGTESGGARIKVGAKCLHFSHRERSSAAAGLGFGIDRFSREARNQ